MHDYAFLTQCPQCGQDTYVFNRGDGIEVVQDAPAGPGDPEASVLVLGPGVSAADVKFRLGSLMVDLGQGDAVHFNGFDANDPLSTPVLDSIQFADGTQMSYQDILIGGDDFLDPAAGKFRYYDSKGNSTIENFSWRLAA